MLKSKNIIILIIFLFYTLFSFSQNLPNFDFEDWEQRNSFNNPVTWGTSNFSVYSVYNFNPVIQEEQNVFSGNSCVKLETIEKNISGEIIKVAGIITLGTFDIDLSTRKAVIKGGIPFTNKPTVFSGYYKYSTTGIDSCIMSIFLTKFNSSTKVSDTLGMGVFTSNNQEEWSIFEAPIQYNSNENPDSMNIVILSSDTSIFDVGSTLFVDKLFVDATLNLSKEIITPQISVFPNPASDYIKVNCPNFSNYNYSLYDITGKKVMSSQLQLTENSINISNLNPGLYFIQININNYNPITKSIFIN